MVDAMRQEHVILLNEQDQPCGTLEKYAAHTATTPALRFLVLDI